MYNKDIPKKDYKKINDNNCKIFGNCGKDQNQFGFPWGITINNNNQIFISENSNNRIQVFQLNQNNDFIFQKFINNNGEGIFFILIFISYLFYLIINK